jgi:hypothetical protein
MAKGKLHPMLAEAVRRGIMTEAQARDVDALCDGLATQVEEGALTVEQGGERAAKQAVRDATAWKKRRRK